MPEHLQHMEIISNNKYISNTVLVLYNRSTYLKARIMDYVARAVIRPTAGHVPVPGMPC